MVSKLEELLIQADVLIRNREYRQVIAAIQPFEKEWTANHGQAPDVAPKLLFLLGSAYGGAGIRDKALATLLEAARMSSGDTALLSAIMEVTADLFFEIGDIAHAVEFSTDSLALVGSDWLSKAQSRSPTPRYSLAGQPIREINLLADGYPVTFWGGQGMPHEGSDLVMTVILVAAAELAAKNAPRTPGDRALPANPEGMDSGQRARYPNEINRDAVDALDTRYQLSSQHLRLHRPEALR